MFLQASQLEHQQLISLEPRQPIGKVDELVFDPASGRLLALGVRPHGWFVAKKFLAAGDILGTEPGFVITRKNDDLATLEHLPRVAETLKKRTRILKKAARTESGEKLGVVVDVLLETERWQITKYYLRSFFAERILPAEDVHSITRRAVIFFDRVNQPGGVITAPEVATP